MNQPSLSRRHPMPVALGGVIRVHPRPPFGGFDCLPQEDWFPSLLGNGPLGEP